ncbi:MAG: hypothetical protein ACK5JF_05950 [Oscillospiraceae bacterium]
MSGIQFKWYFTAVVEHFMRLAVRYREATSPTSQRWLSFTQNWIEGQSAEDGDFIRFVFAYRFRSTIDGLNAFVCEEPVPLQAKRERLARLEKQFALDAGLCGEDTNQE